MLPGIFPYSIYLQQSECNTFFASCLFRFASVKFAKTGFLLRISEAKTVNIKRRIIQGIKLKYKHFLLPVFFLKYSKHFCWKITFIRLSYFFRRPVWKECTEKKEQKGTRWNLKNFPINSISKSKNKNLILEYTFKELEFKVYWNK